MNKRTFLFLYEFLLLGGIENNVIEMIQAFHELNMRIVWLRYGRKEDIYEPWKAVLEKCNVEIVETNIDYPNWISCGKIEFSDDEEIIAVAFDPSDFVRLETFSHCYENKFSLYYIVPHFERDLNYVEEYYLSGNSRKRIVKKLCPIYKKWYENGNLLFFNRRHAEEMNKRYAIGAANYDDKILKKPIDPPEFCEKLAINRATRTEFRIISCGRFSFPHKGYMFGLIDAFAKLKREYSNLYLDLVGYGPKEDEDKIKKYVENLDPAIKDSICFYGAVSPVKLTELFNKAHVNVSVAGALVDGAISGLVSIPARHYTYECQVYGWLDDDFTVVVSDAQGENVEKYIRMLIEMSDSDYIQVCKKSYMLVRKELYERNWLLNRTNNNNNYYSEDEVDLFKSISRYRNNKLIVKNRFKYLIKPVLERLKIYDKVVVGWRKWKNRR